MSTTPLDQRVPLRIAASWGAGTFATTTILNGVAAVLLYFLVNFAGQRAPRVRVATRSS
jgi:hypothetical protein